MDVLILQVFVSLMLVVGSLVLFGVSMRQKEHEHADRLSLLPMADDDAPVTDEGGGAAWTGGALCRREGGAANPPEEKFMPLTK